MYVNRYFDPWEGRWMATLQAFPVDLVLGKVESSRSQVAFLDNPTARTDGCGFHVFIPAQMAAYNP